MTKPTAQELAAGRAAGLRKLADMVEAHPELNAVYLDDINVVHATTKDQMAAFIRAGLEFGAKVEKTAYGSTMNVDLHFGAVTVAALGHRAEVCERVVVGTETVTKKVKDPDALAAVPEIEVTEEVEIVRWDCHPILAGTAESAVA